MKRLWFSQGQKVSCVYFCFFGHNSPIIMNSCRSKSDCRRGNMDLTMTFRTVTITTTTTTKRDEENDNADTTRRRAKRFILENVQIRTRSTYYINDDDDVTCIIRYYIHYNIYVPTSQWVLLFISQRRRLRTDPTDKCRSRMNAVAIIRAAV